jgi:hypothetical protein
MRLLSLAMALAFAAGSVSIAQACPGMKSAASEEQQIVSTDKAPEAPSTPIVIPEKKKSEG